MIYQYRDVPDLPLPSVEESKHLANRAYFGSIEARDELVRRHLHYATRYAYRVWGRKFPHLVDDIRSAAVVGLVKAASTLAPHYGSFFVDWLKRQVGPEVRAAIYSGRCACELPRTITKHPESTWDAIYGRWKRFGRKNDTGASVKAARGLLATIMVPLVSADRTTGDWVQAVIDGMTLAELLEALDPRDRDIIVSCYGLTGREPESTASVGARLGLLPRTVEAYRRHAVERLQEMAGVVPRGFYNRRRKMYTFDRQTKSGAARAFG